MVVDDLATGVGVEERDDPQGEAEVVVDLTEAGNGISSDTAEVTERKGYIWTLKYYPDIAVFEVGTMI